MKIFLVVYDVNCTLEVVEMKQVAKRRYLYVSIVLKIDRM